MKNFFGHIRRLREVSTAGCWSHSQEEEPRRRESVCLAYSQIITDITDLSVLSVKDALASNDPKKEKGAMAKPEKKL